MLALFSKVLLVGVLVAVVCWVIALFSTDFFTAHCTDKLLSCLPSSEEKWHTQILIGIKCVFQNLGCVGKEFISIFK